MSESREWKRLEWAILGFMALAFVVSCSKPVDAGKEDKKVSAFAASDAIAFPADNSSGVIDLMTAPAGSYVLTRVHSYGVVNDLGSKAAFTHDFATPGSPKAGDGFSVKSDWGTNDRSAKVLQILIQINLPYSFDTTGSSVTFNQKHYYWHYVRTDDDWAWRTSGGESPEGAQFYKAFDTASKKGAATYEITQDTTTLDVLAKTSGTNIVIYANVKDDNDTTVLELTYKPK